MAQSRNEEILEATLNHQEYDKPPQSREEELLIELKEAIEQGGGGGGGTTNYEQLTHKPNINGVQLIGNKTSAQLGLQDEINSENMLDADLIDDSTSVHKFPWVGTADQYAQEASNIPTGVPVIITDDTDMDSTPTTGSQNPVTSDGIKTALDGKQDSLTSEQLTAVNSGITAAKVGNYDDVYGVLNYNALNHNGIYRGKDLTNVYTIEQMYEKIHDGSFDDLYLGDYFTKSITTDIMTRYTGETFESGVTYYEVGGDDPVSRTFTATEDTTPQSGKIYCTKVTKTENVTLMFTAFDYYYNMGDAALTTNHAILIPRGAGFATTAKMNQTNTTVGGYYGSDMHQITLPCYAKSLKTMLGNHLLSHKTWLTTTVNASTPSMAGAGLTGAASASAWETTELQLMNEVQLYGSTVLSSSWYDVGIDNEKLPVFNFINPIRYSRYYFWLRSVASSTNFARCSSDGAGTAVGATAVLYVRPLILFG